MMTNKALITGAAGGMGRACARLLGNSHELVLTDLATQGFDGFVEELRADGNSVQAFPGDLGGESVLSSLAGTLDGPGRFTVIHTAGIGPSQGDWRRIIEINLIATERLLRAIEPRLVPGSVGILIASLAAHMMPLSEEIIALLDDPLDPDLLDKLAPIVDRMAPELGPGGDQALAYVFAKCAVRRMAEQRAEAWGKKQARIVSISPGVIMTPMGRREMVSSPGAAAHGDAAALGRKGTPMDIALTAQFLASDAAAYVTGTDLRVDGGSMAVQRFHSEH